MKIDMLKNLKKLCQQKRPTVSSPWTEPCRTVTWTPQASSGNQDIEADADHAKPEPPPGELKPRTTSCVLQMISS